MDNVDIIARHINGGCNPYKRIGLELEHFVCDENYSLISYREMVSCLEELHERMGGAPIIEDGKILGLDCGVYTITLEPGRQYEISISPRENVLELRKIYLQFHKVSSEVFGSRGYRLLTKGVFPLVENGQLDPAEIPILPKRRYHLMDEHFEGTGKYGKYMMRGTCSTQVAVDYKSMEDAMLKIRVLSKLSPILALITENQSGIGVKKEWKKHLLRTQIWNDLDPHRCGYFPGSVGKDYSFKKYAEHVYTSPSILIQKNDEVIPLGNDSAKDFCENHQFTEIDFVDHLLSMFFPNVRLKEYIEYRVADSMDIEKAVGYASLVKALVYDEKVLLEIDEKLSHVNAETQIYEAEDHVALLGYDAVIYGKDIKEWISWIFDLAEDINNLAVNQAERNSIRKLKASHLIRWEYVRNVQGREDEHGESVSNIREYMSRSTAKNHDRAVKTLYIPKLFTKNETDLLEDGMKTLFSVFKKVMWAYRNVPSYRKLFGFSEELDNLILRPSRYNVPIPMSRVDIFFDENTRDYKFCEFNTDGTSAMNEDRELVEAFKLSEAQKMFEKKYQMTSYELFDSWVDKVLEIYEGFRKGADSFPNVAIVDILENGTISEFEVFEERFRARGIRTEICDIRSLTWDGENCYTPEGMKVDVIYRRAVTADIMAHYNEVTPFLDAVKVGAVCLIGEFKTQIIHNKKLFKVIRMRQTLDCLTREEEEYVKAHFPITISLTAEDLDENPDIKEDLLSNKDRWIIKPEDSYGSKGIFAGIDSGDQEWKSHIEKAMGKGYIVQEFIKPYREKNLEYPHWKATANLTGIYLYGGKIAGFYSRVSFDNIISTQYNEMALPTFLVK